MAKEEGLKIDGVVTEVLPNAMFRVKMPGDNLVIGYISGKMRQHKKEKARKFFPGPVVTF